MANNGEERWNLRRYTKLDSASDSTSQTINSVRPGDLTITYSRTRRYLAVHNNGQELELLLLDSGHRGGYAPVKLLVKVDRAFFVAYNPRDSTLISARFRVRFLSNPSASAARVCGRMVAAIGLFVQLGYDDGRMSSGDGGSQSQPCTSPAPDSVRSGDTSSTVTQLSDSMRPSLSCLAQCQPMPAHSHSLSCVGAASALESSLPQGFSEWSRGVKVCSTPSPSEVDSPLRPGLPHKKTTGSLCSDGMPPMGLQQAQSLKSHTGPADRSLPLNDDFVSTVRSVLTRDDISAILHTTATALFIIEH